MTRNLLARTRGLLRERWAAHKPTRPLAEIISEGVVYLAGLFAVVAVGVGFSLGVAAAPPDDRPLLVAGIFGMAVVGFTCYRIGARRSEAADEQLDYAARHFAAINGSALRDDLAEVGPITGETPAVEMFDQDSPVAEVPA